MAKDFAKRLSEDDQSDDAARPLSPAERFRRFSHWVGAPFRRAAAYFGLAFGDEERTATPQRSERRRLWSWRDPFGFSTIAGRIAALNVVALGILVGGVLYLSQFREGLIDQKIESLTTEAQLIAITIAEAAGDPEGQGYDRILANEVLRRLSLADRPARPDL